MIPGYVEARVARRYARDVVQRLEELAALGQVLLPLRVGR